MTKKWPNFLSDLLRAKTTSVKPLPTMVSKAIKDVNNPTTTVAVGEKGAALLSTGVPVDELSFDETISPDIKPADCVCVL